MNGRCQVSLFVASWLLAGVAMVTPSLAEKNSCAGARDVKLVNGKIHTLDGRNSIVQSVTIKNGKFTAVGTDQGSDGGPCMRVINLGGRTAVPGLVDNHNHFVLLGLRPGRDTRLESATSIADVQAAIRARTQTVKPRRVHHRHGRVGARAVRRKPPADAGRVGCRRAEQSGARVPDVRRAIGDQYGGTELFAGKGVAVDPAGNTREAPLRSPR